MLALFLCATLALADVADAQAAAAGGGRRRLRATADVKEVMAQVKDDQAATSAATGGGRRRLQSREASV